MSTIMQGYRDMLNESMKIRGKDEDETLVDTDNDENVAKDKPKSDPAAKKPDDMKDEDAKVERDKDASKANAKTKKGQLNKNLGNLVGVKEASGDKAAYTKFFNAALKKFAVSSLSELEGEKEKEFYNYIDANWEGENEVTESRIRSKTLRSLVAELTNKGK